MQRVMDVILSPENLKTTSGLSILLHGVITPDATSYDNNCYITESEKNKGRPRSVYTGA